MSNINISHDELGTITAMPNCELTKEKKFMIKSLAFLQLICMTPDEEEDENFGEFIEIISKAASEVRILYGGDNESSSIEQF